MDEQRRRNMQRIRSKDTKIELVLRSALWHRGYRYRKNYKGLPGTPDIVLTKYKIAIFCDSEFFHGKDWENLEIRLKKGRNPKYWICKIRRNIERDNDVDRMLDYLGWTVVRFWGEDILKNADACVDVVEEIIFENSIVRNEWEE